MMRVGRNRHRRWWVAYLLGCVGCQLSRRQHRIKPVPTGAGAEQHRPLTKPLAATQAHRWRYLFSFNLTYSDAKYNTEMAVR